MIFRKMVRKSAQNYFIKGVFEAVLNILLKIVDRIPQ